MKLPDEAADWMREAEVEKRLQGIIDPSNSYPRQYAVIAEAILMLSAKLERIDNKVSDFVDAGDDGHCRGDYD